METQVFLLMVGSILATVSMLIMSSILKERKIRRVRKIILRRLH
jgi:hypothetical protein